MNIQAPGPLTPRRDRRRRGYGTVEIALAVFVLVVAMNLMVKALGVVGSERRRADRRLWAVQTASNVLEHVSAEPFDGVTPERVRALADAAAAGRVLPGAAWEVAVTDDGGAPVPAKRVALRLRWTERAGEPGAAVRLSTWLYRGGKGS